VNCTFSEAVNGENSGGKLFLEASTSGGGDKNLNITDRFEVLNESPGDLNMSLFSSKPKYDYLYCGSPLYGGLSPQRVREWIAYHVRLFGERSHFVIHDAGGVHEEVLEVLKPWMELGYVTLQDVKEQERFDGYYHNQFMVVNDCLHRYKFMAKWMFFFDVDEYIYLPPKNTIKSVLDSLSGYTQFTFEQMPMSSKLCLSADYGRYYRYIHAHSLSSFTLFLFFCTIEFSFILARLVSSSQNYKMGLSFFFFVPVFVLYIYIYLSENRDLQVHRKVLLAQ
jgi:hypothetical protein